MAFSTKKLFVAAVLLALPMSAESLRNIRDCVNSNNYPFTIVLMRAETIASRMFATAGVGIEWHAAGTAACHESRENETILLDFALNTPAGQHQGAVAYAKVYEAVHLVVMIDRIEKNAEGATQLSTLLAHVMAHEITHLLEGIDRHSATGVMKAHWDEKDIRQMAKEPLPFAPEDIDLIHRGLARHTADPAVVPRTPATASR